MIRPDALGHVDVTCPSCGQMVRVEFIASDGETIGGAFHVGLSSRYTHDCRGPDNGERLAS